MVGWVDWGWGGCFGSWGLGLSGLEVGGCLGKSWGWVFGFGF